MSEPAEGVLWADGLSRDEAVAWVKKHIADDAAIARAVVHYEGDLYSSAEAFLLFCEGDVLRRVPE